MYGCWINTVEDHTMGHALLPYINMKIHPVIQDFTGSRIVVRGKYNRDVSIISDQEKCDKLFNFKRPTVEYSDDANILYLNCFPGIDYVQHYALLLQTFFHLYGLSSPEIIVKLPSEQACLEQLHRLNLKEFPESDIVILGKVEKLEDLTGASWQGGDDFYWSSTKIDGKLVTLLGCTFTLWGDIAGHLIRLLKNKKVKMIFYIGKLGGIAGTNKLFVNETLATGNMSMLHGTCISWMNHIKIPQSIDCVQIGHHITLFSPLVETKKWLALLPEHYSFVDPEIGHMAFAAQESNMQFSYLHIVSDILGQPGNENLSNERDCHIIKKRELIYAKILEILTLSIKSI